MTREYPRVKQLIGGQWVEGRSGRLRAVTNPSDGSVLTEFAEAGEEDIDAAIAASVEGFAKWRKLAPLARADILLKAAALLRERNDQISRLASMEEGHPFEEARGYLLRGAEIIEWEANEGRRLYGRIIPTEPGQRTMVVREPVGPVVAFTPWNAPVFTPCRKLSSVLAAGCSLIIKGAEETPAGLMATVQCFIDAGVPDGVIGVLYGNPAEISARTIASPAIRLVTFTGSVPVGRLLAEQAGRHLKPAVMELGGHAPVIVCEDADIADAAKKLAFVKYRNAGQACLSPTRFSVHESVHAEFLQHFVAYVATLKVGGAFEAGTTMGPMVNERRVEAVSALIEDARSCGATVAHGGARIESTGSFYQPTVLADVPDNARIMREEPFGPVAVINRYSDLDTVIAQANSVPYGLAGYVFTRSSARADQVASCLECGTIGVNHLTVSTSGVPFGGVKDSGFGREGGIEGIQAYTVAKTISHLMI